MKYLAAIFLSFFLFVPTSQAGPSTDTSTIKYELNGVEHDHPNFRTNHNNFYHYFRNLENLWTNDMEVFDYPINHLDRRIDHLNSTLKSLYLITCGNAITRPDECSNLTVAMHNLLNYNRNNPLYYCPFNIVADFTNFVHDEGILLKPNELSGFASHACHNMIVRTKEDYNNFSLSLKEWFRTEGKILFNRLHHDRKRIDSYALHSAGDAFVRFYKASHPQKYFIYQRQLP